MPKINKAPNSPEKSSAWIPLVEYAVKSGISLSTLRRYIKSDKIEYRTENGKYYIAEGARPKATSRYSQGSGGGSSEIDARLERLETELAKTQEELSELKMLVALYEDKLGNL